jgi:hypothetical protein
MTNMKNKPIEKRCIACTKYYNYMSQKEHDDNDEYYYDEQISHSTAYCEKCHRKVTKEMNLFQLMHDIGDKENFKKIPTMQKKLACALSDVLPSDICLHCGKKVKKDKSGYYHGVTYFNICGKRCRNGLLAAEKIEH